MSQLTILGGPSSGKTTYLAALITALRDGVSTVFDTPTLPDDAAVIERLEDDLLDGRYPLRTASSTVQALSIELPFKDDREAASLDVSDYAGEEVERLFERRDGGWSAEWNARAHASGVLIFIRPPKWEPLPRIKPRVAAGPGLSGPERIFARPELDTEVGVTVDLGDETRVPTELAAIELLQFLRFVRGLAPGERPPRGSMRVAVLISAWDAVDASWKGQGPEKFVKQNAALLQQYLWSNYQADDVQIFGLSATGGDLRDPSYKEQFESAGNDEPTGFVVWSDADGLQTSHDVTIPLAWALMGNSTLKLQASATPE